MQTHALDTHWVSSCVPPFESYGLFAQPENPDDSKDATSPKGELLPLSGWLVLLQTISRLKTTRKSAAFRLGIFLPYPDHYSPAFASFAILYPLLHDTPCGVLTNAHE